MTIPDINKILSTLHEQKRENVLDLSFALLQWMDIEPNAGNKPQLLSPQTQKLKEFLAPAPQTVQPQLYRISADNQNIRVRFAVLKKLKKEYISQLVDNDPGLSSYQTFVKGLTPQTNGTTFIPAQPYFIHFVTTPDYDRLVLIFNQGEQKRIVSFRNRLTNTQYNKIIELWQGVGTKSKPEIAGLLWKSLDLNEVNKEFYIKIKERFDALLGIMQKEKQSIAEKDLKMFAIRLIGRYIFCWFLKEKEIIHAELISSNSVKKYANFYNRILKPLFFDTLNTFPYPERKYSKDLPEELQEYLSEIPYLNGGLFEPSAEDALIPEISIDDWLLSFVRLLEQYSFTVDESSPAYEQVAIDPEMLGKILENLLASLNPETEKIANERNALGAFYTPRPIVDYMVTESLKVFFESQLNGENNKETPNDSFFTTDKSKANLFSDMQPKQLAIDINKLNEQGESKEKIRSKIDRLFDYAVEQNPFNAADTRKLKHALTECKILDPACGSGAFPMGALHKLEMLHEKFGTDKSAYDLRRMILSQNIYGVDILPMAVEISRLRAWLALVLVCDYKRTDKKHNFGIKALPNLDFKFVSANTLVSVPENEYVDLMAAADLKLFEELTEKYFNSYTEEKEQVKKEIKECIDNITSNHERAVERYVSELKKHQNSPSSNKLKQMKVELAVYEKQKKQWYSYKNLFAHGSVDFFATKYFFPSVKDGFDIVIGNPPYVQLQDKAKLSEELLKTYSEQNFKTFENTGDVYCLFYEKGNELLKRNGILFYISSNKWMRANYGQKLRHYFINYTNPILLFDFSWFQVFENASVDSNLFSFTKKENKNKVLSAVAKSDFEIANLRSYIEANSIYTSFPHDSYWAISGDKYIELKSHIVNDGRPLYEWDFKINYGLKTGFNEAFFIDEKIKNELIKNDKKNNEIIKPLIRGRDVERYGYKFQNLYLINTHNGVKELEIKPINVKSEYPIIYTHLLKFKKELETRADKGDNWYNLRNCAYLNEFKKEKLIWAETMRVHKSGDRSFPRFGYDNTGIYTDKTVFIGVGSHLKYLLAFLNSSIGRWLIMEYVTKLDTGGYMMQKSFLDKIPILVPSNEQENNLIDIVDKILQLRSLNTKTKLLEKQIDLMLYSFYNLTYEEAKIIDAGLSEEEFEKYKI